MNNSNKEKFIEKAKLCHKGQKLDYSQVEYVNNRTPVKIIDRDLDENGIEYGEYWQTPSNHLKGQSHPRKKGVRISKSKRSKTEEIIERFKNAHKDENLDYSQVEYVNMHTKVKIISHELDKNGVEYGEFWQEPCVHLKGCSHPRMAQERNADKSRYTTDDFVQKCIELYGTEKYSFDKVEYINSKTKVDVFCNKIGADGKPHGYFKTSPDLFLQGKGCPKCGHHLSNNEDEIYNFVCGLVGDENVIHRDTTILGGPEIDIYVPSRNIAIEYDGLRWHSEMFGKDKYYHLNKTDRCQNKGITLFHVFEDEYLSKKELVLDKISHALFSNNSLQKIGARNCTVSEIGINEAKIFLNKYHIQGFARSTMYLGAFYNDELIAVMTFQLEKKGTKDWILNRFCGNTSYRCQGIAGKLFNYFVRNNAPESVVSFLDRRWEDIRKKNVYDMLGFSKEYVLGPEYRYTKFQGERIHKFNFRKKVLNRKFGLPLSLTEREMAKQLGYFRIWDCGLVKYVWKTKKA